MSPHQLLTLLVLPYSYIVSIESRFTNHSRLNRHVNVATCGIHCSALRVYISALVSV